jgi:RNA polymerase sigma factor for flagellar operon FliA
MDQNMIAPTSSTAKARVKSRRTAKPSPRTRSVARPAAAGAWPKPRQLRPGSAAEGAMVEQYLPLVRNVVGRLALTLPPHVDGEDLYSAGLGGLLNAVRQYNPRAGTAFETYARLRIRGSVFDELRRMDWVPRSIHAKARKVQATLQHLEQIKGRLPTEEEMAEALDLSTAAYRKLLEQIRPVTFVCLDSALNQEHDDSISPHESMADLRQENPLEGTFRREMAGLVAERIKALPETQRRVLALYYYEDMRLREIAEIFNLTESRICQIHAQAILAIKAYLQNYDPHFA